MRCVDLQGPAFWLRSGMAFAIALSLSVTSTMAQEAPPSKSAASTDESKPAESELTADAIQARLKAVEANKDLDEIDRSGLLDKYSRTLQQLKHAEAARSRAASFTQALANAPADLRPLKQPTEMAADASPTPVPPDLTLSDAQQELSKAETRLADAQKRLSELQAEPERRGDRRIEIPKLQDGLRQQLADVDKQLAAKPSETDLAESTSAALLLLKARKSAIELEFRANHQELAYYEASGELLTLQRDQAKLEVSQAELAVKQLQEAVNDRRRREAQMQARDAERAAVRAHPAVKAIASENAELANEREERARGIEQATALSKQLEARTHGLDDQFEKVRQRAKRVGLGETLGLLLRKHLQELPNLREHKRRVAAQQAEIVRLSLRLLELEDDRVPMADIDALVAERVAHVRNAASDVELPLIEDEIRQLMQSKRDYLDSLIADTNRCQDKLVEVNSRESQLIAKSEAFKNYADQNVLWIRSAGTPGVEDLRKGAAAAQWLLSAKNWTNVVRAVGHDLTSHPLVYLGFASLIAAFGVSLHFCKRKLKACGIEASRRSAIRFRPTSEGLLLTIWLAIGWSAGLWTMGWRLVDLGGDTEFVFSLGVMAQGLAVLVFALEFPRQVCRREGLGESHFNWSSGSLLVARRNLRWLTWVGLPFAALVLMMEAQAEETFKSSLGRVAFIMAMLVVSAVAWRIWHSPDGLIPQLLNQESDVQWRRIERFWHVTTIGSPLALALLAAVGFYYTAVRLTWWMVGTVLLLVSVVLVHALMLRWLLLAYRALAMQRARERRAAEAAAAAAAAAAAGSEENTPPADAAPPEPVVSLSDVNQQTRNLLRLAVFAILLIGLWLIWRNVLPALGIFNRVSLWPRPFAILDASEVEGGTEGLLTLADLLVATITALVTYTAARNIPGLLELTVLRHLALDAGVRNAVSTLSRYAIVVVGAVVAFGRLGIGWSKIQWLAAAISVGLGFGLQEIFANFVSGLILLFERPIRIGDVVSVGDVTGKVSRIRIRATTIIDGDMRELIVPNKDLITGRVMNWTLSETTARMTIHVGVAYGVDPDLVRQLLLTIAREHPLVLSDPAPHALFDGFGDSAIDFTLRVYLSSLDTFLTVRHELHTAIAAAFQAAHIEIPFPQRELRWRNAPEMLSAMAGQSRRSGEP